ncbi:unnamed protein product [Rotaria sordida]|uniref:ATP-dependent RNA helicase DDX42 n=1 Tax=Rotaria sordida TaxID=392033 RepID=A0A818N5A8_9BILA|nr:unnamed protein product [Rotaria sordida]
MDSTQFTMNAIIIGLSLSNDYFLTYIFINELGSDNERSNEVSILAKRKNNSNEHIERLYSHKIKSRTLELNVIVDETIKYLTNEINRFNLQLLLSLNDCCKNYADIVVYDQNGNRTMSSNNKPVDPKLQQLFPLPSSLRANVRKTDVVIQPHRTEQEYFDSDDLNDESHNKTKTTNTKKLNDDLDYQPAPGSPSYQAEQKEDDHDDDEEEDPLEQFMKANNNQAKKDLESIGKKKEQKQEKGIRDDIDKEDDQESYFRWLEENPNAGLPIADNDDDEDRELQYDDDGNLIAPEISKHIDPLPSIDHSTIEYSPFEKNFYVEHEDIRNLSNQQVNELRNKLGVNVRGVNIPRPVVSFAHFGFDERLMKTLRKSEFTTPTPIQSQAIPSALSGRDIIGIAKTGSGKTGAFIWPAIVHIMAQEQLKVDDGPIVLICAPTRELAQQIHLECKKYGKLYNINSVCAFGGGNMHEQIMACKEGCEILVCTPGRLIDLVKKKGTNLQRVTYLVFDEADRMFDMGFEPQVRSIADHVRPDRQCLLFSATFKKKVEKLARDILTDPVRIVQGEVGEANQDILQIVHILLNGSSKWAWLLSKLVEFTVLGKVLIFVTRKDNCAELAKNLKENGFTAGLIHGDMAQYDRTQVINEFKKHDMPILVATDVAARGLDIPSIRTVVNYDVARDIDTHTHRIGRTGRAGEKGTAYTLLTPTDKEFAPNLVRNLENANQVVSQELLNMAMQNSHFANSRSRYGGGGGGKHFALGNRVQRERPGFGSHSGPSQSTSKPIVDSSNPFDYNGPSTKKTTTIGPMTDWRGGSTASSGATGTNRTSAMKAAFQSQFKSSFVAATDTGLKSHSVAVPSSVTQKRAGQTGKNDSTSTTKRSRFSD